jgi:hypothetical protein
VGVPWTVPAEVNGRPWPVWDGSTLWLPPGPQAVQASPVAPPLRLADLNAQLQSASVLGRGLEFAYRSSSRAIAIFDRLPTRVEIDGEKVEPRFLGPALFLPRGQHFVTAYAP